MTRISFPTPETMNADQLRVYQDIIQGPRARLVGPLRAALHNPELADRWQKMGALLRFGTSISPRASELAILVAARRWNSQLEWHIHAAAAQDAGLPQSIIDALLVAAPPLFDDIKDGAVYEYARQLLQRGVVKEAAYQEVLALLGEAGTVELTAIIGYYSMVAMTLNAHHIPLPDVDTPLPLHPVAGNDEGVLTELPQAQA